MILSFPLPLWFVPPKLMANGLLLFLEKEGRQRSLGF